MSAVIGGVFRFRYLLFHGDRDPLVPLEGSERLAALRPDLVRLIVAPGAVHAASWNVAPARYEQEVRDFLVRDLSPAR